MIAVCDNSLNVLCSLQVNSILNRRERRGKKEYLIRWKGFDSEEDSWEPVENLLNCMIMVKKFEEEVNNFVMPEDLPLFGFTTH